MNTRRPGSLVLIIALSLLLSAAALLLAQPSPFESPPPQVLLVKFESEPPFDLVHGQGDEQLLGLLDDWEVLSITYRYSRIEAGAPIPPNPKTDQAFRTETRNLRLLLYYRLLLPAHIDLEAAAAAFSRHPLIEAVELFQPLLVPQEILAATDLLPRYIPGSIQVRLTSTLSRPPSPTNTGIQGLDRILQHFRAIAIHPSMEIPDQHTDPRLHDNFLRLGLDRVFIITVPTYVDIEILADELRKLPEVDYARVPHPIKIPN